MTFAELIYNLINDNTSIIIAGIFTIIAGIFTLIGLWIGSILISQRERKSYRRDRLENFGLSIGEFGYLRLKNNDKFYLL